MFNVSSLWKHVNAPFYVEITTEAANYSVWHCVLLSLLIMFIDFITVWIYTTGVCNLSLSYFKVLKYKLFVYQLSIVHHCDINKKCCQDVMNNLKSTLLFIILCYQLVKTLSLVNYDHAFVRRASSACSVREQQQKQRKEAHSEDQLHYQWWEAQRRQTGQRQSSFSKTEQEMKLR